MTMVMLCSAAGAPGVTTTALAMTLAWPGDSLLVDADRNASQAVLAGHLGGADAGGRGLTALTRAHRERRSLADELPANLLPLAEHESHRRSFLPGFSQAGSATLFQSAWPELADNLHRISRGGTAVVIDAGRVGDGLPGPLLAASGVTLLLTGTSLRALAATRIHLSAIGQRQAQLANGGQLGLVLIGEGNPYSGKEISQSFGVPVWGVLPEDAGAAAVWSDGEPAARRHRNSALAKAVTGLVARVAATASRPDSTGSPPSPDGWSSSAEQAAVRRRADR